MKQQNKSWNLVLFALLFAFSTMQLEARMWPDSLYTNMSPKRKIAYEIFDELGPKLEERHQMSTMGTREAGMKLYEMVGLSFEKRGAISKDEGRKIILDCVDEFLEAINSHQEFQQHLANSHFTEKNLEIILFVKDKDGRELFHPNISVFALKEGVICYKTKDPEKEFGYKSEKKESYEKARETIAYEIFDEVRLKLEEKHQMSMMCFDAEDKEPCKMVALAFGKRGVISKDEGRKIILDCVKEFLQALNFHQEFQPYLANSLFTEENLTIVLLVEDKDGRELFHPNIFLFSIDRGKMCYLTKDPEKEFDYESGEKEFDYKSKEEESYEEALKIVESQKTLN